MKLAIDTAKAVEENSDATSVEITQAYHAIIAAVNHFKQFKVDVDFSKLKNTIDTVVAVIDSFTFINSNSIFASGNVYGDKNILTSAFNSANAVYNNALSSQNQVDNANANLESAFDSNTAKKVTETKSNLIVLGSLTDNVQSSLASFFDTESSIFNVDGLTYEKVNVTLHDAKAKFDKIQYKRPTTDGTLNFGTTNNAVDASA